MCDYERLARQMGILRRSAFALMAAATVAALLAAVWWLPAMMVRPYFGQITPADQVKSITDSRTAIIALAAGLAAIAGLIFSARTYLLTRSSSYADRYGKAVAQLADANISVRIGAVYALRTISQQSQQDRLPVGLVLAAFIRTATQKDIPSEDVQAAVQVLGREPRMGTRPNLQGARLAGINMSGLNLSAVNLSGADLSMCDLRSANLTGADLTGADLAGAKLAKANFRRAILIEADMRGAEGLDPAKLKKADTTGLRGP
jgi:CHASE3 domain sensor protein